ncbi:MAG: transglutaminase domain-containing protein [Candidatus Aenigmarchaeota archaeon]|nr:transglutaminase domain-containing protein [Candidatus Aenigmarchaeota archaeon]
MKAALLIALLLLLPFSLAEDSINAKRITDATFHIVKSGTIKVGDSFDSANLTVSVPQKGIQSLKVNAQSWRFINDSNGNRVLLLEWKSRSADVTYEVDMTVKNKAIYTSMKKLGSSDAYLKPNSQITFNDKMRDAAFPYERTMERAAGLAIFVHDYLTYDLSLAGELKPSDWVMENRRGVCVEFANLLSSLLKISGIPTRYAIGYAYSSVENKLVGHTWVEILAEDGTWIPIDPTWNQAGYLDATHVVTAYQQDANQSETFTYTTSGGKSEWQRNDDVLELADYAESDVSHIRIETQSVSAGEKGYMQANITTGTCMIAELRMNACAGEDGSVLDIYDPLKEIFACASREVYWFFNVSENLKPGFAYSCPVTIYSQTGSSAGKTIGISGERKHYETPSISGPGTVFTGEKFSLAADPPDGFIFYNDELGRNAAREWPLSFSRPGDNVFYMYAGGGLDVKTVSASREREFSVSVGMPENASEGNVTISVGVTNVANSSRAAMISVTLGSGSKKQTLAINSGRSAQANFTFALAGGRYPVQVSVAANGIYSYDGMLEVKGNPPENAGDIISSIFAFFESLLRGVFG